jgi:hypothetical protein
MDPIRFELQNTVTVISLPMADGPSGWPILLGPIGHRPSAVGPDLPSEFCFDAKFKLARRGDAVSETGADSAVAGILLTPVSASISTRGMHALTTYITCKAYEPEVALHTILMRIREAQRQRFTMMR